MNYRDSNRYKKSYEEFVQAAKESLPDALYSEGFTRSSDLASLWLKTVESGKFYSGSLFDWDKEVSIREQIEAVLENQKLKELEFYGFFMQEIEKADERFREISVEISQRKGRTYWWERRILKFGVGEYEDQVRQFYGIESDEFFT